MRVHLKNALFEGYIIGAYSSNICYEQVLLDMLENTLPENSSLPCILIGDMNINTLRFSTCRDYLAFLLARDFRMTVDKITRPATHPTASGTCLDHVAIRNTEAFVRIIPGVWRCSLFSDHYPVFIKLKRWPSGQTRGLVETQRRSYCRANIDAFGRSLQKANWIEVYQAEDTEEAFSGFRDQVFDRFQTCFPLRGTDEGSGRSTDFHFSAGLRRLRRNVNKLYARYRKTHTADAKTAYYCSLGRFRRALHLARTDHYRGRFQKLSGDPRAMWKFVKRAVGRSEMAELPKILSTHNGHIDNPSDIADELNRHFASVGPNTVRDITTDNDFGTLADRIWRIKEGTSFDIGHISVNEVLEALNNTKARSYHGVTGVPSWLLKLHAEHIVQPLTRIYNLSVESGVFPTALKDANITPLYKRKGDVRSAANYRPIALVDYLSKVLEKIVKSRLERYLAKHDFFTETQFGFRKQRSTTLAMAHLWNHVVNTLEERKLAMGVFLDVAAAFICLNIGYLLRLLECAGCTRGTICWFRSYMEDRRQAVTVGEIKSPWININMGAAQGSIIGPFVFIILMNFVLRRINELNLCKTICYADDTSLIYTCSRNHLQRDIDNALKSTEIIIKTFEKFGLRVNSQKTNIIIFRPDQAGRERIHAQLFGTPVAISDSVRCLGFTLDEGVGWTKHLDSMAPKAYAVIAALRKLRDIGIPRDGLKLVYRGLLVPLVTYGIVIWGGGLKKVSRRAQVILNDGIRAICGLKRHESVREILVREQMLRVEDLCEFETAVLAFKSMRRFIPEDISFQINEKKSSTTLRRTMFTVPRTTRTFVRQSLLYRLPKVWSSLPGEFRKITSLRGFRRKLRDRKLNT